LSDLKKDKKNITASRTSLYPELILSPFKGLLAKSQTKFVGPVEFQSPLYIFCKL